MNRLFRVYWRVLLAVMAAALGVLVVLVSLWQRVQFQVEQQVTPALIGAEEATTLLADLSPIYYGLPEPQHLPPSLGYYRDTAAEWIALFREQGRVEAVERRRVLAELRVAGALQLLERGSRAAAMENAARGVVYLSRAAEDLLEIKDEEEIGENWSRLHESSKRIVRALLVVHASVPAEWRSIVNGWMEQVLVVQGQAKERLEKGEL